MLQDSSVAGKSSGAADRLIRPAVAGVVVLAGLFWAKTHSYVLFHSLAEVFSIVIGAGIFIVAWNSRRFHRDSYLLLLGVGFLTVAGLDLVHTLAFKGLSIFHDNQTNRATQLWIAARYVESLTLLGAGLVIGRRVRTLPLQLGFAAVFVLLLLSIFYWPVFPTCYVEGRGLTPFKWVSEYVICGILLAAMVNLWRKRAKLDGRVLKLLLGAMALTIAQELAFTLYHDPYANWNFIGHCLKILAFSLVYKAIVETCLSRPYDLLFFDLKKSETSLRESEDRFRTLAHASFEGICISEQGRVRDCNDQFAAMLGYEREELLGKELSQLLAEEYRERVLSNIRAGIEVILEHEMLRQDGSRIPVEAHGRTVTDQGRPIRITALRDITARRAAEQDRLALLDAERAARREVEHANRMKDEFLATVSHELRSPLSAILGWTRLLRRGKIDDTDRALGIVERSAESLTQLIEDILDMGRIMSGKVRLDVQEVELRSLVADVVDGFRPAALAKGISLHESYDDTVGVLRCDPARIRQVLSNLLGNALKFTPTDGNIFVQLRRRGHSFQLIVRDTGQGIKREFLPHLFGKFLQSDSSTTRRHGGLGLGLAIVKQIVELHGGTVRAASAGEGRGATFVVSLPNAPLDAKSLAADSVPTGAGDDGLELPTGMDILLIDDDRDALAVISRILAESGANVIMASSAEEGLRRFREHRPRLVVSDISMPGEDGYSLIRRIRAAERKHDRRAICVALSSLARREDRDRALSHGFDEHLSKLSHPTTVVQTLRRLVIKSAFDQFNRREADGEA